MSTSLKTELFCDQKKKIWPKEGRHILAQYDDKHIVVYQAFCPEIAEFAVENGKFGGPKYSFTRMTWIKTNFLWMMYRSNWARSRGQERILAITLCRDGFDEILRCSRGEGIYIDSSEKIPDHVRLQWDPDHSPNGSKIIERRAVQLGLRGDMVTRFNEEWVKKIEDITDFVKEQHDFVLNDKQDLLCTPSERVYIPNNAEICKHILLDGFAERGKPRNRKECTETVSILDGACCSEMLDDTLQVITEKKQSESKGVATCNVILCLGGAFNPVHTRHIQVMVEAKKWLEENTHFRVTAGFLAVAPDGYVKKKCEKTLQMCIRGEHRIKMCEIACEGYDWLNPYKKPIGSAEDCGKTVKRELKQSDVDIAVIYGADRAMNKSGNAKWHKNSSQIIVCIGRKGETEQVKMTFVEDKKMDLVRNENFFIVPKELDDVSSTGVRKMLFSSSNEDDTEIARKKRVDEVVTLGWVTEKQGQYIIDNYSNLFNN
ncbi:uncharacterized protein LOC132756358 [Ruditapes philippinarum]|uniref:uncharacterized protein LOC132756358 n=1 Tax=Ruditapes philippinarum TaxID=129788 RepID=UPI00295C371C|nr:uncharacterized protein LOC132756358 [Ruditapes philippinarum]